MNATILEDGAVAKGKGYEPLNGQELKRVILSSIERQLEGEHGLFSIGKAWPRASWSASILISGWSEDAVTVEVEGSHGPEGEINKNVLLNTQGETEPPDDARRAAGLPAKSNVPPPTEDAFLPEGQAPVKVKRGRS